MLRSSLSECLEAAALEGQKAAVDGGAAGGTAGSCHTYPAANSCPTLPCSAGMVVSISPPLRVGLIHSRITTTQICIYADSSVFTVFSRQVHVVQFKHALENQLNIYLLSLDLPH